MTTAKITTKTVRSAEAIVGDTSAIIQQHWRKVIQDHRTKDHFGRQPSALIVPEDQYRLVFGTAVSASFYGTPVYPRNRSAAAPKLP